MHTSYVHACTPAATVEVDTYTICYEVDNIIKSVIEEYRRGDDRCIGKYGSRVARHQMLKFNTTKTSYIKNQVLLS